MNNLFSKYYKSLTLDNLDIESDIASKSINNGVVPYEVRYELSNGFIKGVIKSSNNILHNFNYYPNYAFNMKKAADPFKVYEAEIMLEKGSFGFDLIKASQSSGDRVGGVFPVSEDQNIKDQEDMLTEGHPSAATITSPDDPSRGKMWHEQQSPVMTKSLCAIDSLRAVNKSLNNSTDLLKYSINPLEKTYIEEVLGKSLNNRPYQLSPQQKVNYRKWLGKSINNKVKKLDKWIK